MKINKSDFNLRNFLFSYGFVIVLVLVIIFFSVTANNFFEWKNFWMILHTAAPMMVLASGLAFVIMTAQIDLSGGSIAFLACGVGAIMMTRMGIPIIPSLLVTIVIGMILGALNGFIFNVLHVNPLITTIGTQIALRGLALTITNSLVFTIPEPIRILGNLKIGPVYVDIIISIAILIIMYTVHTRTKFGRQVMALGNGFEVSSRLGVRVRWVSFWTFVLSGLMASLGGILMMIQVGQVYPTMGAGYEFSAIAMLIIGGVSLFGGVGSIIPGVILGGITLTVIEAGLNFLGASPFLYPFVRGGIIFVAMFADSLKTRVRPNVKMIEDEPVLEVKAA
jgi:ribose/xylose/arabinose/galactoside ABC-type transport system permease subunit